MNASPFVAGALALALWSVVPAVPAGESPVPPIKWEEGVGLEK